MYSINNVTNNFHQRSIFLNTRLYIGYFKIKPLDKVAIAIISHRNIEADVRSNPKLSTALDNVIT